MHTLSPTSALECFVDELCALGEVHVDVALGDVEKLEALVLDAERFVKALICVLREKDEKKVFKTHQVGISE